MSNTTVLLTNRVHDARSAMCALIESRAIGMSESDPGFPAALAELAWKIADAMAVERGKRSGKPTIPPPARGGR